MLFKDLNTTKLKLEDQVIKKVDKFYYLGTLSPHMMEQQRISPTVRTKVLLISRVYVQTGIPEILRTKTKLNVFENNVKPLLLNGRIREKRPNS